jgi:hypothetical protein
VWCSAWARSSNAAQSKARDLQTKSCTNDDCPRNDSTRGTARAVVQSDVGTSGESTEGAIESEGGDGGQAESGVGRVAEGRQAGCKPGVERGGECA